MRLIPPSIGATENLGERAVYQALEAAGSDAGKGPYAGWTVLHSLDIADHNRQVAGEIDFLAVVPGSGVLVMEVKGVRRLGRRDGVWVYGDGSDARLDRRGPFKQASSAMHSVRERLVRSRPHLGGVVFWSAVCFPFLDFAESSEEWHSWQVIDRRAMAARPLPELLLGVLENGRRRMADRRVRGFDPAAGEPTVEQCREIVDAVRPDFEFFESPRSRARRIEEEVRRFTEEQFAALDSMARNPRVVFDGPAGTGKTLLAMEAARRAADRGSRVLFLCFNLPLRFWLADQLAELRPEGMADRLGLAAGSMCGHGAPGEGSCDGSGPGVVVRSLHEQMLHVAGMEPPREEADSSFWTEELPEKACERLVEQQVLLEESAAAAPPDVVDEIVVDEAQDILSRSYLDFLDYSLRGRLPGGRWRIFGDFQFQRIYREHGSMTLEEFDPDGRWPVCRLLVNCRNTPSVAQLACACVGVEPSYCRVARSDDVPPEIHGWDDAEDQAALLVRTLEELHEDGFSWDDIVVLSTVADLRSACASLPDRPWGDRLEHVPQYTPGVDLATTRRHAEHVHGRVRCATIHRFKGLESRAVVITDVDGFDETTRALLYVGATRTVERLVLLAERGTARRLRKLVAGTP